jgi:hypothetical protein
MRSALTQMLSQKPILVQRPRPPRMKFQSRKQDKYPYQIEIKATELIRQKKG